MAGENFIYTNGLPNSLPEEETKRLIKLMLEGDFEARQQLIESNMRLVTYRVSTRYGTVNYDKEELISLGNLGLIKAVDTFDPAKETALSTYAIKCIDNEINMFLRKLKKVQKDISLNQPVNIGQKDNERHIEDFLSDGLDIEEEYINTETILRVRELVKKLPPALRETVNLYYGFNGGKRYTQEEMAKKANCYQSTIQKRLKKAEKLIKRELEKQETHNYLTRASTKVITPPKKTISANKECKLSGKTTSVKTFYELLSDFSKEDIDSVINRLSEENKSVIMQRYNNGLDRPPVKYLDKKINKRFYAILTNIKGRLIYMTSDKKTRFKCLYDNFPEYSKEQVDQAILVLGDEEKQLILTRYNGDFNNRPTGKLTTHQSNHFYCVTIPKIKRIIIRKEGKDEQANVIPEKNPQKQYSRKTFYELLSPYPKEWVDEAFESLTEEEKQIILDRYSGNLNFEPVKTTSTTTCKKIHKSIIPKIKHAIAVKHSEKGKCKTIYEYFCKYSKEQIDKAIASLSDEEKKIVLLRYDGNLNNSATGKLTEAQRKKFYGYIVPKIRNRLSTQDIGIQNAQQLARPVKPNTEEGKHLDKQEKSKELTPPKRKVSATIECELPKKKPRGKTFYELLSEFSKEDIDNVVKGLTEENKSVIMQRYSEGLNSPPTKNLDKEIKKRFYAILTCVRKKLTTIATGKKTRFKYLYENFPEYSKSQVDKAISVLNDEEKQLILTRYNGNFNNRPTGKLTTQQKGHFYYVTIPKIKKILISQNNEEAKTQTAMGKNSIPKTQDKSQKASAKEKKIYHGKTFYEYFSKYSKDQIDKAILSLTEEEKKVIFLRYDGDLNNPATGKLTEAQKRKFYSYIVPKIKNNLIAQDIEIQNAPQLPKLVKPSTEEVEELTKEDYQKVLELIKNKDFAYIIHGFESKEIMMIILLLGYINSKSYSISTIAKFLEISESEAVSAGKSALKKFKQRINQIMEGEDFSTQGAILPTEKDSGDSPFHM
ncbi:MAG: sigma-70 family RNA polymerase sigma factor [bacterium]|nr:sigma-70 family RNA polymerase sigma factor [bacterium]